MHGARLLARTPGGPACSQGGGRRTPPPCEASGSKPRQPGRQIKTKSGTKCSWDLGVGSNHTCWPIFWVPEGNLAGFCVRHHLALESVCGADFSWKVMCGAGPGDLGGSRGSASTENPKKTGPKISSQTAFRYPGQGEGRRHPPFLIGLRGPTGRPDPRKSTMPGPASNIDLGVFC